MAGFFHAREIPLILEEGSRGLAGANSFVRSEERNDRELTTEAGRWGRGVRDLSNSGYPWIPTSGERLKKPR